MEQENSKQTAQKSKRMLPRYKRDLQNAPRIEIQPRDIEIIKLAHDYRFINSDQIQMLAEGSGQVTLRRLGKLFHNGYIDRPVRQLIYGRKGSIPMIYALGNRGADILVEELGIDRAKINWSAKNSEVRDYHIFHTVAISQARTIATLAARKDQNLKLLFWEREGKYTDSTIIEKNGKNTRIPIAPDGFFGIEYMQERFFFFLEADQSTMTNKRYLQKLRGYWNYWKEGGHTRKLGIKNFRVLTIAKTNTRKNNLCQAARKADDKQKGSNLFWFISQAQLTLEHPEKFFFENLWETPKEGGNLISLLAPIQKQETEKEIFLNSKIVQKETGILFENTASF